MTSNADIPKSDETRYGSHLAEAVAAHRAGDPGDHRVAARIPTSEPQVPANHGVTQYRCCWRVRGHKPDITWVHTAGPYDRREDAETDCDAYYGESALDRWVEEVTYTRLSRAPSTTRVQGTADCEHGGPALACRFCQPNRTVCTCDDGSAEDDRGAVLRCPVHGIDARATSRERANG